MRVRLALSCLWEIAMKPLIFALCIATSFNRKPGDKLKAAGFKRYGATSREEEDVPALELKLPARYFI
jgi:hypothetical protein